ncbi:MAG: Lrp/AsnC ligand binding domain-containing protein [Promethearchaeati archaeon SRVP18_Atabeyarchaeia-1]
MVIAYIMGKVEPGSESAVRHRILKLEHVGKVSVVYGDLDFIVEVEAKDLIDLRELTEYIRRVEGVTKTITYLVRKES